MITEFQRIIDLYDYALGICYSHNFTNRAAQIHCKRAEVLFKIGHLQEAIQDADCSIDKDPDHLEVQ